MEEEACLKRKRSEESPYTMQTKKYINEKIVDSHDENKMKQIHDKTKKLLFQGSRYLSNIQADRNNKSNNKKTPLSRLVVLSGNGLIDLAKGADDLEEEFLWIRRKAKCCDRNTYVQSECINCQKSLCEECGYSCTECQEFLCNMCVVIFGTGDHAHPICENCSAFL